MWEKVQQLRNMHPGELVPTMIAVACAVCVALAAGGCGDESPSPSSPGDGQGELEIDDAAAAGAVFMSAATTTTALAASTANAVATLANMQAGGTGTEAAGFGDTLLSGTCPVITYETTDTSFSILLDYGDGCVADVGGQQVSGSLAVEGAALDPGVSFAVAWNDYSVDGVAIDGTASATLVADTATWSIQGTVSEGGAAVTGDLEMSATLEQNSPADLSDDEWIVRGGGNIQSGDASLEFTIDDQDPLVIRHGCEYPVSGTVAVTSSLGSAAIDYGDGTCDSVVTIWVGPFSREVDLELVDLCDLLGC